MNEEIRKLFHLLADLTSPQREAYYLQHRVPAAVRAELESLLSFDRMAGNPLTGVVGSGAEELLHAGASVPPAGRCGPYRLVRRLGSGRTGPVYLAVGECAQQVAIRFLRASADLRPLRQRLVRGHRSLASLHHPGIARLLETGQAGDCPYLVMEYVEGTRIDHYAAQLDLRGVLAVFLRVCEAVSYAHRNLVVHGDLKPSRILVTAAGDPKILDFGIPAILDECEAIPAATVPPSPGYASPERLRGDVHATTGDVYSLGAVLYRLLTGGQPGEPPMPASKDLRCVLAKAMRTDLEERYRSVDAFAQDLRAYLERRPVRARSGDTWYRACMFFRRYFG
jgi:serine/threonine protein kinase